MSVFGTSFNGVAFNGGQGNDSLAVMAVKWNEFPLTTAFESVFGSLMPVANNDRFNVERGESVTLNILANDSADPRNPRSDHRDHHQATPARYGHGQRQRHHHLHHPRELWPRRATASRYTVRSSTGAVSNEATVSLVFPVVPDTTGPVPTITTTAAGRDERHADSVPVTFNENVTGFDADRHHGPEWDRVGLRGRSGQPALFTFDCHPDRPGPRSRSPSPPARPRTTRATTASAASKIVTFDTTPPTVTIDSARRQPDERTSPIPITITFSEPVTVLMLGDIIVTNGDAVEPPGQRAPATRSASTRPPMGRSP